MTVSRTRLPRFSPHLWLALGMFVVFAASFVVYAWSEWQSDRANESRQQSYLLADELRQSSDSDALTRTEFAAMNVIDSADPPTEASRAGAIATLYDAAYHQAKAGIMRPIGDFQRLADQRTLAAVEDAMAHATRMRLTFILFGLALVFLLWRAQRNLHAILGGSVDNLHGRIAELGSGKLSRAIPSAAWCRRRSSSRWRRKPG